MSASKGGGAPYSAHRSKLQPRLIHLISGLRVHQVEEAVQLLLDYIDQASCSGHKQDKPGDAQTIVPAAAVMPMALCEAKKLTLRPGQPYVFLPDEQCASCRSDLAAAVNAYGLDAVNTWLDGGRKFAAIWDAQEGQAS